MLRTQASGVGCLSPRELNHVAHSMPNVSFPAPQTEKLFPIQAADIQETLMRSGGKVGVRAKALSKMK